MQTVSDFFGCHVFSEAVMQAEAPEGRFQGCLCRHPRGQAAGSGRGQRRRQLHEGLGDRAGRYALYALVPAADRHHGGKARHLSFLPPPTAGVIMEFSGKELIQGEPDASSLSRPAACAPRLRRAAIPRGIRRPIAFIKDERIVHPDRVLLLRRRSARQEDAAAALHAGDQQAGRCVS